MENTENFIASRRPNSDAILDGNARQSRGREIGLPWSDMGRWIHHPSHRRVPINNGGGGRRLGSRLAATFDQTPCRHRAVISCVITRNHHDGRRRRCFSDSFIHPKEEPEAIPIYAYIATCTQSRLRYENKRQTTAVAKADAPRNTHREQRPSG